VPRGENGVPMSPAGTLALIGDLKQMDPNWVIGLSYLGYGPTLAIGVGIPIPILDEEMLRYTAVKDEEIFCPVVDYSQGYPYGNHTDLGHVSFKDLKGGRVIINGKEVVTTPQSSYPRARQIAAILKSWIKAGQFELTQPVAPLPGADSQIEFKSLPDRQPNGVLAVTRSRR
jgi:uncharacterized protein (DUF39 family)